MPLLLWKLEQRVSSKLVHYEFMHRPNVGFFLYTNKNKKWILLLYLLQQL